MPPLWIIREIAVDTITIAIISFAINFSICDVFSKKHKYKINPTQELFAYGASNVFGSFFTGFTSGGSLSRSVVLDSVGAKTQLVSLFSAGLMAVFLLKIGPLLEPLPKVCIILN